MAVTLLSSHGVAHLPSPTSAEHFSDSQQQQRYRIVEERVTDGLAATNILCFKEKL
ncbi:hypothetical protein F2Q69_00030522 [Brassica cretica]|uniref:Uncharacterized protein n=1 Tax=Brassica cretica TaxID=69181 RepID=A0A8S9S2D9_BRACR|nr:hypothetical protein F2Q69_00030522 [Brassica cretica]